MNKMQSKTFMKMKQIHKTLDYFIEEKSPKDSKSQSEIAKNFTDNLEQLQKSIESLEEQFIFDDERYHQLESIKNNQIRQFLTPG